MSIPLMILMVLVLLAWTLSILHALLVFENRRYIRGRMAAEPGVCPTDRVTLIVPCKGNDADLAKNLRAYLSQDYPDYETIFVVEDVKDAATPVVQSICKQLSNRPTQLVVAGRSPLAGQKIHNLLSATARIRASTTILAFGDADAHPGERWLRWFVERLQQPGAGAVTGYRWYRARQFRWPSLAVVALNNLILGWMGRGQHFLVWGGSWAIRRELFHRIGTCGQWTKAISDDLVVSRCLRDAGQRIEFVPQCLCASEPPETWLGALEFLRRQLTIVRCYQPRYWVFLFLVALGHTAGFFTAVALILPISSIPGVRVFAAVSLLGLYGFSVCRGVWRDSIIRAAFPTATIEPWTRWLDIVGMPIFALLGLAMIVSSCWSNTIRWRGIEYQLDSYGNVRRLQRDLAGAVPAVTEPVHVRQEVLAVPAATSGSAR